MLIQIWRAFSILIIQGSLQRCFDTFSVIKDDKDDVSFYLNMFSVRQALLILTLLLFLRCHFPHLFSSLNLLTVTGPPVGPFAIAYLKQLYPILNLLTVTPIFECRPANIMSKFK